MALRAAPQLSSVDEEGNKRKQVVAPDATQRPFSAVQGLPAILPGDPLYPHRLPGQRVPEAEREYLQPMYGGRFRCIGSACEDTCCKDWDVPIDRLTYEKYSSSEILKPHIGGLIVLNTEASTTSDYARIPLTGKAQCPFLDSERLCGIQKQLGAEMLSVTCATYPRAVIQHGTEMEHALNLSCPEATRLTLMNPHLLGGSEAGTGIGMSLGAARYSAFQRDAKRLPGRYQPQLAIRDYALLLLSDRNYALWQRLYLLDILAKRLESLRGSTSAEQWSAAYPLQVAKLLSDSALVVIQGKVRPTMDAIKGEPDQQLQILVELLKLRVSRPPVPTRFMECLEDFHRGIGTDTARNEGDVLRSYVNGYERYYRPLMVRHPHLMENYLTNHIFKNGYPFGRPRTQPLSEGERVNAESEHLTMCVHVALAQMLLIGMANRYGDGFGVEHVVKLVQSLAKTIEHSQRFLDQIPGFLQTRKLNNPRGIALLMQLED